MILRILGNRWERKAETFLRDQGLKLRERNFHCRWGEIDLIFEHGETVVFVEVRYRRDSQFGGGAGSVTRTKQQRLIRAASVYLAANPALQQRPCRFDVVDASGAGKNTQMDWIKNAFQ